MTIFKNILELVGKTPLVKINKMNPNPKVTIYAKLEKFNPGGSVKDRIAKYMIEEAERKGILTKNKIIIEPTSGNTGIGLAMASAIKGYKIKLVMPDTMSIERRKILEAYGAEVILTPGKKRTDGAIEKAKELVKKYPKKYVMLNQFDNFSNPEIHYKTTAQEIIDDVGKNLKVFVAGIGTSGTVVGVGGRLKKYNPKIQIVGIEPQTEYKIPGLKNMDVDAIPKIYNVKVIDEIINVFDEQARDLTKELALKEGLFVGPSSGAAMYGAIRKARQMKNGVIVVIFPDGGERYISSPME